MCFSAKHNDVVNYRVDRMEQVRVEAESADQRAVIHASQCRGLHRAGIQDV